MDALASMWIGLAAGSVITAVVLISIRNIAARTIKQERGAYRKREQMLMEQRERLMTENRELGQQVGQQQRMDELQAAYDRGVNDGTLSIARMTPKERANYFGEAPDPEVMLYAARQNEQAMNRGIFNW